MLRAIPLGPVIMALPIAMAMVVAMVMLTKEPHREIAIPVHVLDARGLSLFLAREERDNGLRETSTFGV